MSLTFTTSEVAKAAWLSTNLTTFYVNRGFVPFGVSGGGRGRGNQRQFEIEAAMLVTLASDIAHVCGNPDIAWSFARATEFCAASTDPARAPGLPFPRITDATMLLIHRNDTTDVTRLRDVDPLALSEGAVLVNVTDVFARLVAVKGLDPAETLAALYEDAPEGAEV